ncbi:MAG TPA: hypothetical protein VIS07_05175 [Candidatus Binatia bacterium]
MRGFATQERGLATREPAVLGATLSALVVVAFVAWFVTQERWIYFFDWAGYWRKTIDLASHLRHDVLGALATVLRTIRRDEYSFAPVLPLAPPALVFGSSRLAYVLSIAVLYGVVAAASLAWFADRALLRRLGASREARIACGATIALQPLLWVPTLMGLPDVIGCVVLPWAWWLLRPPPTRLDPRRIAIGGLLLALLVVLRRWYAYAAVGLLVALALESALLLRERERATAAALRVAALGGAALAIFLLLTGSRGLAMLRTDYATLYAAYASASPLRDAALGLWRDFGPVVLALALGGAVAGLVAPATRARTRVLLVQALVAVLLFTRTQSLNLHHDLLLVALLVLAGVGVARALDLVPAAGRVPACVVLALALVASFAGVLVPSIRPALGPLAGALPGITYGPLVRGDLDEVARLVRTLDDLTRAGNDKIYVLSSSTVLNEEVVANAYLVDRSLPALDTRVLPTSHVDLRDGFPFSLLMARFVVVGEPIGHHLDPRHQQVVGIPAREILRGSTLGRAYVALPGEFELEGGVRVRIFARTRDVRPEELEPVLAELRAQYPGRPGFTRR